MQYCYCSVVHLSLKKKSCLSSLTGDEKFGYQLPVAFISTEHIAYPSLSD